ncbi:MAG: calcium-binding protein [Roseinatronobacter sp.]
MLLALFGALAAGAASDTLLSARAQNNDDDRTPDEDSDDSALDLRTEPDLSAGNLLDTMVPAPVLAPQPAANMPQSAPVATETPDHELAETRIHSSDLYPEAPAAQPVVRELAGPDESLNGGALDDTLSGGSWAGLLAGHGGDDWLIAGSAPVHMIGGEGCDSMQGGAGDDSLEGCTGDDLLIAGTGDNVLLGGDGNDTLIGVAFDPSGTDVSGQNFLNGGDGDDLMIAGGDDYLHGGAGTDTFGLGDWLQGRAATIVDYVQGEDQILLHFDPARVPDPLLDIRFDADAPETAQIWLNDQLVAQVQNAQGLTLADVGLVPITPPVPGLAAA